MRVGGSWQELEQRRLRGRLGGGKTELGREEVDSAGTLALASALASIIAGLAEHCLGGPGWLR